MRATLLIFAALGLAAICLAVVIAMGVVHLTALDPIARPAVAANTAASGPGQSSAGDGAEAGGGTDASTTQPDAADPEPEPTLASRSVFLAAADAKLTGPAIALIDKNSQVIHTGVDRGFDRGGWGRRRSPRAFQPFIARWNSEKDVAEWTFPSPAAGNYAVSLVYSAPAARGEGPDGAPFVLSVGGEPLVVHLKPTARAGAFEMVDVGTLSLPAGEIFLTIHPQAKQSHEAIQLRSVRLYPAK